MTVVHIIPAHGRDYKFSRPIKADMLAGKDFLVCDVSQPWDRKPINLESMISSNIDYAHVRYFEMRKVVIVDVKELAAKKKSAGGGNEAV